MALRVLKSHRNVLCLPQHQSMAGPFYGISILAQRSIQWPKWEEILSEHAGNLSYPINWCNYMNEYKKHMNFYECYFRFAPDSTILVTAGDNGAICIWDLIHRSLIKYVCIHSKALCFFILTIIIRRNTRVMWKVFTIIAILILQKDY